MAGQTDFRECHGEGVLASFRRLSLQADIDNVVGLL